MCNNSRMSDHGNRARHNGSGDGQSGDYRTMAQRVAARLRDLIAQDQLSPGDRIRERDIAEQLSVSRTPLREALRILAAERLVELLPNRGAVVADPTPTRVHGLDLDGVVECFPVVSGFVIPRLFDTDAGPTKGV